MDKIEFKQDVPMKGEYDIIVAGGGVAGVAAAVAAARMGKKVLLIEKTISLGGLATIGLVNLFVPMCNGRGTLIIKGLAKELFDLSVQYSYDTVPEDWQNGEPGQGHTTQRYVTKYSAPIFTLVLAKLIKDEGVDLLYDTVLSQPVMENNICTGVIVDNKGGFGYYKAKMVIDTTGDADVLFRAGVPTVESGNFHTYYGYKATLETLKKTEETKDFRYLAAVASGGVADLYGRNHPADKPLWHGTTGEQVTAYALENQMEFLEKIKGDNRCERDVLLLPTMPQLRTTRRIDGDFTLRKEDCYKHFATSISAVCDFDNRDYLYEVPYETLVKTGFPNLITAGRCASGDGYAWDILRVIPVAIVTAQAAGIACSMAIDDHRPIYDIDVTKLQSELKAQNVMIHFDDSLVPSQIQADTRCDVGHI